MVTDHSKLRAIPSIDKILMQFEEDILLKEYSREFIVRAVRDVVDKARDLIRSGQAVDISAEKLASSAKSQIISKLQPNLRRLINATGVVLHTNLGRAPLSKRAKECVVGAMEGYSTLEYNIDSGERGSRYAHIRDNLKNLTGAEDVLVVNNNAAAVLLVLAALCKDKEVIVSRGELVEIGGSFRIPDVLKQSGAQLVEVGTTNKTHLYDYERAISPNTGAILKVHTSNYCIVGFTSQPEGQDLASLAHEYNIPVFEDLGSGTLIPLTVGGQKEPTVSERLKQGFDLVTFSGDKLLGASQAGIIAGKSQYIDKMKKHPLLRAIRIDKLSLAALEGTLMAYESGAACHEIPVHKMLQEDNKILAERARCLTDLISSFLPSSAKVEVITTTSPAGGGALPTAELHGWGVALSIPTISAAKLETMLRRRSIPIIVRIQEDRVVFDVRCLMNVDLADIADALRSIV